MMGIHPNPSQLSVKTSAKYVSLNDDQPVMEDCSRCVHWWWTKLSRVKIIAVIGFILTAILFVTYHVLAAYGVSHVHDTGSVISSVHLTVSDEDDAVNVNVSEKIRYKHTKRRLPHCIVIGIRKAGTRALTSYLNLHPHIATASKEIHFFDNDEEYSHGLEWYRKKMPYSYPEQLTKEKSPAYFATKVVPDRVHHMNSSIRLLLVVREPVDRTVSDYLQITLKKQSKGYETKTFEQMVLRRNGEVDTSYPPLTRSVYYMYMDNWLRKFDLSQFHFVDGERLVKNPLAEMQAVEKFLGLEHRITKENFFYNESRGFYCIRNETREKCLADSKGRKHPDIDPGIMRKLKMFFKPYNERFFELIGRRFDWD